MKYRWELRRIDDETIVDRMQEDLNQLPEALARTLVLRKIDTLDKARHFFRPSKDLLHDPLTMAGMGKAVARIVDAIQHREKILVYGDYDVDGTTSVALMVSFLNDLDSEVDYFIPNRIEHGYGLSKAGIDVGIEKECTLIIALDCGISAIAEAQYARDLGIDLIICDHHTPPEVLPDAYAILNPKRVDCPYPFKDLSACGVGFKLIQALATALSLAPDSTDKFLDLVALSIGADIVPVEDENRVLMSLGIQRIKDSPRVGISQLAVAAGLDTSQCSTSQIVFGFAPRINAAGRVEDASAATELLMTDSLQVARHQANNLEELNDRRRTLDQSTLLQATKTAERMFLSKDRNGVVLFDDRWHPGVIGITASRIVERFYRPAILLTEVNGIAKGSARSIRGLNVYDVLSACSDLLLQFGGHDYAAGMSLEVARVDEFRERFDNEVGKRMRAELMIPSIRVDSSLSPSDISDRFWAVLKQFEPFGPGNGRPVYLGSNLSIVGKPRIMGKDRSHVKFRVRNSTSPNSQAFDVIGFGMANQFAALETGATIDLLYSIEENNWRGNTSIEFRARDFRPAQAVSADVTSSDISTIVNREANVVDG